MLITGFYAGLLSFVFIALGINIIRKRLAYKVGLGDGGHHELAKTIRVHANFAEHVPLALILIGICDYTQYSPYFIHVLGATLFVSRLLHAYGLGKTSVRSFGRTYGVLMTYGVILIASIALVIKGVQAYI